jgi:putative glutathione S-transferase
MGIMIDGTWRVEEPDEFGADGRFVRATTSFRSWVTADGRPGPSGAGGFEAAAGRYHLYAAISCPWAHRTLLMCKLKGLENAIGLSLVAPRRTDQGWVFEPAGRFADRLLGSRALHEIYRLAEANYSGRVTVPLLFDRERRTIVNNESAEIIRMLNAAFGELATESTDYYPEALRPEIDTLDELVYRTVNNGVYRAGFARSQAAYEEAFDELFATLDRLEERLSTRRYLLGDRLTEADIRLFPTLIRFDVAYHGAFKCNLRRLVDYPNLWGYVRELYQWPGVAETVDLDLYKQGYYARSALRNPLGIVPKGPAIDLAEPHGRERLSTRAA